LTKKAKITKSEKFGVWPLRNKLTFRTMDLPAAITWIEQKRSKMALIADLFFLTGTHI
jgi:hypothetical protein